MRIAAAISLNRSWHLEVPSPYRAKTCECEIQEEQAEVSWPETFGEHEDQTAYDADRQWVDIEPRNGWV